jgi:superfamily I DNA/RNA helicase
MTQAQERDEATERVIASDKHIRVIVSGPGTGKTTTFRRALAKVGNRGLVLTFIKALREDLGAKLPGTVRVTTFHGYCYGLLRESGNRATLYAGLLDLVADDLARSGHDRASGRQIETAFHDLDDRAGLISAAIARMDDYQAVHFVDVVYRTLMRLEARPEQIEVLPLVVVDEYQDFSLLETRFVALLASRSPLLVAGDDDQALYSFKRASPEHLRALVKQDDAEQFALPFCSRCTQVIVNAVKDVIASAVARGRLRGRLVKPFECYLPDKGPDSEAHPKIIHVRISAHDKATNQIGAYLTQAIARIAPADIAESRRAGDEYPTVLVLGPEPWIDHAIQALKAVYPQTQDKRSERRKIMAIDGYGCLADNGDSKLGWRILLQVFHDGAADAALTAALRAGGDIRPGPEYRTRHAPFIALVQQVVHRDELTDNDWVSLETQLRLPRADILERLAPIAIPEDEPEVDPDEGPSPATATQPTIVCTTRIGSKGLSAGYVFVVGFVDGYFASSNVGINDDDVCQFLVALSRTRKECHLISTDVYHGRPEQPSPLLEWIAAERVEERRVDGIA